MYISEMNSLAEEYAKIDANATKHALQLVEHEEQLTKLVHEVRLLSLSASALWMTDACAPRRK